MHAARKNRCESMKVLQINKYFYPYTGGVEQVVYDICSALNDKVDMNVLVANDGFHKVTETINGTKILRSPSLGNYFSMPIAPLFPIEMKKFEADILHFHFPFPLGDMSYLLAKPKGKTILTWHSDIIRQKNILKLYKPFLLSFLKRVDRIVTTSPNMIEYSDFLKRFEHKCHVIPLGVDPKRFELNIEIKDKVENLKRRYQKPLIFFMGRLIYYKGVQFLIEAMKDIDAHLIIGGSGPLRPELEALAAKNDITHKITFEGFIKDKDLPAYYHASDLFVLPSVEASEAFGIVQLEAQVCGKPVVSTNLPTGVPYANKDGITGLIVPPKDSASLSRAIRTLLEDDDLRRKLGFTARERVLKEFTVEKMGQRYLNLYENLILEK